MHAISNFRVIVVTDPQTHIHTNPDRIDYNTLRHSSSERSERFVRFEPNVRSERVRYFSERETNVQALKRLINLIAVK